MLFSRAMDGFRFQRARRMLGWLRSFPWPQSLATHERLVDDLEQLRRGDPAEVLARQRATLDRAVMSRDARTASVAAADLIGALVVARRWSEAVSIHQRFFMGSYAQLFPVTIAMLARAYGVLGRIDEMTSAVTMLEERRDRLADVGSLNVARVVYLAYQGAASEIDFLLGADSGLLAEAPGHVRFYYRGIAHHRAGNPVRARELFARALEQAPEEDRPIAEESIETFLGVYRDIPPAAPPAQQARFMVELADSLRTYAAVPPPGIGLRDLPVTWGVTILNTVVWIVMALRGDTLDSAYLIDSGALYEPAIATGEWWRLLTPIALHAGFVHLAINSLGLLYLGRLCERLYGSAVFLLLYVASGLAGTLASYYTGVGVSVGASGAIYGVLGALIALLWKGTRRFPQAWRSRYLNLMVILALLNLFVGAQIAQVDNAAHIGGLVGGIVCGVVFARRRYGDIRPLLARVLLGIGLGFALAGIILAAYRTVTTSRAETLAALQATSRTVSLASVEFIDLPGRWIASEQDGTTLVQDPFERALVRVVGDAPVSLPSVDQRHFDQQRTSFARQALFERDRGLARPFIPSTPSLAAWEIVLEQNGQPIRLVYALCTLDRLDVIAPVLFYSPLTDDAEEAAAIDRMIRLMLERIRPIPAPR
jgi:membrane associated rhomboid family serine protease